MKWLAPFAFLFLGCANFAYIQPIHHYPEGSTRPIIYGSLSGLPDGYGLVLHLDFKKPDGSVKKTSRAFSLGDDADKNSIASFAFFLPSGEWTVTGLEIGATKEYKVPAFFGKAEKSLSVSHRYLDSTEAILRFPTASGKLHYLGRWDFSGFAKLDSAVAPLMEKFLAQKKQEDVKAGHAGPFSLSIGNHEEADRAAFNKANRTFRDKKSLPTLPTVLLARKDHRFEILVRAIQNTGAANHYNWAHKEMMKPNIPHF